MTTMARVSHIVVHYSATYPDQHVTAATVDEWHRARGFARIGYHVFFRRDGTREQGRPFNQTGAHVGGQNTGKIGLCWAGGLDRSTGPNVGVNNMTQAQERALIAEIRSLKEKHPQAIVCGHRDLAATQCPGFDVPAWWARVSAPEKPAKPAPTPADPATIWQALARALAALAALFTRRA